MIKLICNGCRKEINDKDQAKSDVLATQWLKDSGAFNEEGVLVNGNLTAYLSTDGHRDVFCPKCRDRVIPYWNEKSFKVDAWQAQYKAQIRNHQKDFFSKKNGLEAVKPNDNQELPRLH